MIFEVFSRNVCVYRKVQNSLTESNSDTKIRDFLCLFVWSNFLCSHVVEKSQYFTYFIPLPLDSQLFFISSFSFVSLLKTQRVKTSFIVCYFSWFRMSNLRYIYIFVVRLLFTHKWVTMSNGFVHFGFHSFFCYYLL